MSPGLRDLKHCGTERAPMPAPMRAVCAALIAVAVLGTAYGLVADEPDRKVVTFQGETITLTKKQLHDLIVAARIAAAREALDAKECNWDDVFKYPPKGRKGA